MNQPWVNAYVGVTPATRVYVGTVLVWEANEAAPPNTFTENFLENF